MTDSYAATAAGQRRQVGLALLAAAVALVSAQGFFEWLLPYDMQSLQWWERHVAAVTPVDPGRLALLWAVVCEVALGLAAFGPPRQRGGAAFAAGLLIGSSRVAAGGPVAAIVLELVGGVASLGWQSRKEGGLGMVLALAGSMVGWDAVVAPHPTLWPFALGLVILFVWIERRHIQASDRLLFKALRERDGLITELGAKQEQLTRLQHARTQLLASISHDLRQPLQAVRLYADALRGARSAGNTADLVDRQMRAADDAVAMLDQFSELSAIEQGALRSQPVVVGALEVLGSVADALRATHAGQAIDIRVHGRPLCFGSTVRSSRALYRTSLAMLPATVSTLRRRSEPGSFSPCGRTAPAPSSTSTTTGLASRLTRSNGSLSRTYNFNEAAAAAGAVSD